MGKFPIDDNRVLLGLIAELFQKLDESAQITQELLETLSASDATLPETFSSVQQKTQSLLSYLQSKRETIEAEIHNLPKIVRM